jgi:hypothetical protein
MDFPECSNMKAPGEFSLSPGGFFFWAVYNVICRPYKTRHPCHAIIDMPLELKGFIAQESKWLIFLCRKKQSAFAVLCRLSGPRSLTGVEAPFPVRKDFRMLSLIVIREEANHV